MKISKRFTFEAAHYLPNYDGKCKNIHGHTWLVELEFEGQVDDKTGMIIDFHYITDNIIQPIKEELDHKLLNDSFKNPTSELIVMHIEFLARKYKPPHIKLTRVVLWENSTSKVELP